MPLTWCYGESAGRVAQLAAVERGLAPLNADGPVAALQICSTSIGERPSPAGLLGLVDETAREKSADATERGFSFLFWHDQYTRTGGDCRDEGVGGATLPVQG